LEAARAMVEAHVMWNDIRRMVMAKILDKEISELEGDDMLRIRDEDIAALSPQDQTAVIQRMEYLVAMERLDAETMIAKGAQLEAKNETLRSVVAGLENAIRDGRLIQLQGMAAVGAARAELAMRENSALISSMPAAPVQAELPPEASLPWNDASLLERFWADKPNISDKTKDKSYGQAFRELAAIIGEKPIKEIRRADIKGFAEYLRDRPSSRGGALDRGTIGRLLSHVRSLFAWYVEAGILDASPVEGVVARAAPQLAQHDDDDDDAEDADGEKRRAFTDAELRTLFDSPLFTGCQSSHRLTKPGNIIIRNERYWFWVIALLTGARTGEIARAPAKLVRVGDIDCIDIRRATKTKSSPRLVPVLPELKRLGFMEWAAEQESRGRRLVEGPDEPARWTKWTNYYLDEIGLDSEEVSPYSLRHVFRQQLRAADLHPELADKVFGHKGQSVGAGYGRDLSVSEAQLVVKRVKPPTPLEHLWQLGSGVRGKG
jgi:integrase